MKIIFAIIATFALLSAGVDASADVFNLGAAFSSVCINALPAPKISSFAPLSGGAGTMVTITGANFTGATAVKFNGVAATSFTVVSATSIKAVMPITGTGKISVTTPSGTVTSTASFTFTPMPTIASFTPTVGGAGTKVTITGTNLKGATAVKFNGVAATSFSAGSASTITAVVPITTTGKIAVTTPYATVTSFALFTYSLPPIITSFTPGSGAAGAKVTITGTNLTGATAVKFNGVLATSFTVVNSNTITAVAPVTTTGKISVTTPGGTATSLSSFISTTTPTITSFTPTSGGAGAKVTITGTNLTGATAVKFNGVAATSFSVVSATSITAVVPKTTSGKITVTTPNATATSASLFMFTPAPTIASFTPTSGGVGTKVTITGTNLKGATAVKFNNVAATSFSAVSDSTITAVAPKTTTGKISVTTPVATILSSASFTYCLAPTITSFTPTSGGAGTNVTITGTNVTGATAVKFNGVAATSYTVVNSTTITAVVPVTTTGKITVTTPGGTATTTASFLFYPAPTITSFTPTSGVAGTKVTITGTNFTGVKAVKFNGMAAASFTVVSAASVTAIVPIYPITGKITITAQGGTATSAASFTANSDMIYIPGGSFIMGASDNTLSSYPLHLVNLADYYIGKYEVTRGEYRAFMNAGGYSDSSYWSTEGWAWKVSKNRTEPDFWSATQDWKKHYTYYSQSFTQTDSYPVVGVNYYEAEAFCDWAGGHLPTEAQWERAACWNGTRRIASVNPWGDVWDVEKCNNFNDHNAAAGGFASYQTAPVGSYSGDVSPCGCKDMAGNVMEWCQDWYKSYPGNTNVTDGTNTYRVIRGGSWNDRNNNGKSANRYYDTPANNTNWGWNKYGFRLAR